MAGDGVVGRHDEQAVFDDAIRAVQSEGHRAVMVAGAAGVGKTHLLDHAAGRAEAAGFLVLRTACVELGQEGLPLAPVTAVLRTLVRERGRQGVTALLPDADTLLRLLPELGLASAGHDHQARVFDLFGALLRRLADERALMLVIDDLQWADRSTRQLIGMLARTLRPWRVLLAGAYRSDDLVRGHPLRPFLAELERLPGVRRVEVGPLSRAETAELMTRVLGHPPGREALDHVHRSSAGNPFFVEELARAPDGRTVPESLQDLLVDRIERLPSPADQVVRRAAVGGQRVSHDLLAAAAGLAEGALLEALRAATAAGVLQPDPSGYAFRHRLLRDAVLHELLPVEKSRLHRTYAEALEADPRLVPEHRRAAEVAFHWYGAGVSARALPALLHAADEAEKLYAYPEQVHLLDRALRLHAPGADRLALFEKAIIAATWAGQEIEALDLIDRAASEVDRVAEPERAATLLANRAVVLQNINRDGAVAALEEALELLPADDRSLARGRVLDLVAAVLAMRGVAVQARELAAEAAGIAAEHGDTVLEANALTTLGWMHSHAGRYTDGLVALQAAEKLAREADEPVRLVRVYLNLADRSQRLGEFRSVIDAARAGLEAAERAGVQRTMGVLLMGRLGAALFAVGEWDAADDVSRRATDLTPTGALGAGAHALRAELALVQGEFGRATDELSLARTLLGERPDARNLVLLRLEAELALSDDRGDLAQQVVSQALAADVVSGADPLELWQLLSTAARVAAHDRQPAPPPSGSGPAVAHGAVREAAARLPVDTPWYAAHAAQTAAELGDGDVAWQRVVAAWDALDAPYLAACARLRAAEASLRHGDAGTARQLLRAAGDTARRLGAEPLRAEVDALARRARITLAGPAELPPTGTERFGLTEREVAVLRLVTEGRSNRQIGEELYISPKTVSVHVSNLLGKLGAGSRTEAAALAHRLRLLDPR